MKNHRALAYLYLLITYMIWGFAGPVIKYTLEFFPPVIFLTYRFAISAAVAIPMLVLFPRKLPGSPGNLPGILLYGFLTSTVSLGLLFLGFDKTTALTGSLLSALGPIMTTVAGVAFLHEHVTKREKTGIGIALAGTMLLVFEPLFLSGAISGVSSLEGNLLHIAAVFVGVATAILAKLLLRKSADPMALAHISFVIGFATMLPVVFTAYPLAEIVLYMQNAPLSGHLGVLYMALFSGTIAYTLWNMGQKTIEVGETSLFSYLHPMFAAPLSLLWLHESITPLFVPGALIIAIGVGLAEYRKSLALKTLRKPVRRRRR